MKRILSILLSVTLLLSGAAVYAQEAALPESEHPYRNGCRDKQTYTDEGADRGLMVTFSEDTCVEPYTTSSIIIVGPGHPDLTVGDVLPYIRRTGDYIALLDGNGNTLGTYSGDELAGKTVYVPTNSFSVLLVADAENNFYGYRVTEVRRATQKDVRRITYRAGYGEDESYVKSCARGENASFDTAFRPYGAAVRRQGFAFAGWATKKGGPAAYGPGESVPDTAGDMELWAVWVPLALGSDEVLTLSNSAWYFEDDGREGYYMTPEDYRAMQLNLFKTYGLGPVPSPVLSIVLSTYPDWEWQGSCYGISTVTALQHFGLIDLLAPQDAETMSELEPDDALISRINYYQSQAATSWLTENKAYHTDTAVYAAQLRRMFAAVEDGDIVMFTFYEGEPFITPGHTVLFTGAFTAADGSHVLVAYDCNDVWSYRSAAYDSRFVIAPDYSSVTDDWDDPVGAFNWTADFDQFVSFSADVSGSPLAWYAAMLRHIVEIFRTLLEAIGFSAFGA